MYDKVRLYHTRNIMQSEKMMYICESCKDTYASDLDDSSKNICPNCGKPLKPMGITRTEWRSMSDNNKEEFKTAFLEKRVGFDNL